MKRSYVGIAILIILLLTIIIVIITDSQKSIVGKWKAVGTEKEYYYIFNEDKTCAYEMKVARLGCTYEENEGKLIILYDGNTEPTTYEYIFKRSMLIIKDETGKDNMFIKENK